MKKSLLFVISLGIISVTAFGATTASWAVTDNADPFGIKVSVSGVNKHIVKFYGINNEVLETYEVIDGEKLEELPDSPELSGYTFNNWASDNTSFTAISDSTILNTSITQDTNYYARFASYGYSLNSGNAIHLANKWDISNNINLGKNSSVSLGTYVYGKAALEDSISSPITISHAGGYALVCNEHDGAWNKTYASDINKWYIEKYITLSLGDRWKSNNVFAHFFDGATVRADKGMSKLDDNNLYCYGPYNSSEVIFGLLNSGTMPDGTWSNVKYQSNSISFDLNNVNMPKLAFGGWKHSDGSVFKIFFETPDWATTAPRLYYKCPTGDYVPTTIFNIGYSSNMTLSSGRLYYIDIDSGLPLSMVIVMFEQNGSLKQSTDIIENLPTVAGNYQITTSWVWAKDGVFNASISPK